MKCCHELLFFVLVTAFPSHMMGLYPAVLPLGRLVKCKLAHDTTEAAPLSEITQ